MIGLLGFLLSPIGRIGLGALSIVAFVAWFSHDQQSRGAVKAVASFERQASDAVKKADTAGIHSRAGHGGVRDPYTTADEK